MYAVLYVPSFRLQAAVRLLDEKARSEPLAVVDRAENKSVILEINTAARRRGVQPGTLVPRALARCGNLRIILSDAAAESAAQAALLQTAYALSPEMESTAPGLCTMHLRLAAGKDAGGEGLRAAALLDQAGLKVQAGFAPNPDLAFLAARRARPVLVVQEPSDFLDALPVTALNPSAEILNLLHDWGIYTLQQLRTLPRADLVDRLGPEAGILWQRAAGQTCRPLHVTEPPAVFSESFAFENEIETLDPILFLLRRFLDQLTCRLRCMGRVAESMKLTLALEQGHVWERLFNVPSPSGDPEVLFRILFTHLESLRLEHRAAGLSLRLEPALPSRDQFQLFETALRDPNRLGETLARLSALTGPENTGVCVRLDTHEPDKWRLEAPQFKQSATNPAAVPSPAGLPLRRCRPALPAQIDVTDRIPVRIFSSVADGLIIAVSGPHLSSGQWWEESKWQREEWDAELENGFLLRLARLPGGWVVEGFYEMTSRPRPVPFSPYPAAGDSLTERTTP